MTNQEISELFSLFESSCVQTMKLSMGDFSLELDRRTSAAAPISAPAAAAAPQQKADAKTINAPLVGTFYASASPDAPPYVCTGDRVAKGETVCLIEAMKMMSEVTAPCDCVIEEILAENGALLAYGAPIFRYREA